MANTTTTRRDEGRPGTTGTPQGAGGSQMRGRLDEGLEKAKDTAGSMGEKAMETAGSVLETARDTAANIAQGAGKAASSAASFVGQKAEDATGAVGHGMRSLGSTIREKGPEGGVLGAASSSVASALESTGDYLEHQGLSGMGRDLTGLIRRYPVGALCVGMLMGFMLARATRS